MDQKKFDFGPRLVVWVTISEKGISEPFFIPKLASLTGSMYWENCVKQRLVPLLEEHQ